MKLYYLKNYTKYLLKLIFELLYLKHTFEVLNIFVEFHLNWKMNIVVKSIFSACMYSIMVEYRKY